MNNGDLVTGVVAARCSGSWHHFMSAVEERLEQVKLAGAGPSAGFHRSDLGFVVQVDVDAGDQILDPAARKFLEVDIIHC